MYRSFFKRIFDIVVSLVLFVLVLPFFVLIALVLSLHHNGNPFFCQIRPGKHGKLFTVIKFKTMTNRRDALGNLLPDTQRLTKTGSLLRKLSLDEIPQLLNVMGGDMSLVGPRPLLVEYLALYNPSQARRHDVLPGITGWAQVNGRNAISWQAKFDYDSWYVENLSFKTDIKILFLTLQKVIHKEGVDSSPGVTMEKFTGNP